MSDKKYHLLSYNGAQLQGEVRVPGDKSISHRAVMLGAIAKGTTHITGFLEGEDSLNTIAALKAMGVPISDVKNGALSVTGVGMRGLQEPKMRLNLGNSGTSMRLFCGLLAGQEFACELGGDNSLSQRPMQRVIMPLQDMGARITSENGKPPLLIHANRNLFAIDYKLPMASAQVKSCLLLAGLYANGTTKITEPAPTRDHTERMLQSFGYPITEVRKGSAKTVSLEGGGELLATDIDIPADISSAAFFMVAASIAPNSCITLRHVGINPTRTGVIDILKLMGADIELTNQRQVGAEPVADIIVKSAPLKGIEIPEHLVPLAIDEFPIIFIAAACAQGVTVLTNAAELRVKESDRIQVMVDGLTNLGINAKATADGAIIRGGTLQLGTVQVHDDHRIAMSFAVAALGAKGAIRIQNCQHIATSFPNFVPICRALGMHIEELS